MNGKKLQAKWIKHPDMNPFVFDWRAPTLPAPVFRKSFMLSALPEGKMHASVCGLGFFEFYLNGVKVSESLVPAMSRYDVRCRYRKYEVSSLLKKGCNVICIILGNGLFNSQTPEVWHFDKAEWRDYPKMIFWMQNGNTPLIVSDSSWIVNFTGTIFDSLRGGELFDARLEMDFHTPSQDYERQAERPDDIPLKQGEISRRWKKAVVKASPGGRLTEERFSPCKVIKTFEMERIPGTSLYRSPFNISGWSRLYVSGEAGAKVTLHFGEKLTDDSLSLDTRAIRCLVKDDSFQKDEYILKGKGTEIWEPRFTYHGFQYVEAAIEGNASLSRLEARFVCTAFTFHGGIKTEDERLSWLHDAALRSCLSNFVGIPTDCPHREKNGWTSEAQLMQELLLYAADAAEAYHGFAELIGDAQRINGQLPGMVPSAGWGYNCLNGPVYDSALFTIPYVNWLFTGKKGFLRSLYPHMLRYLDFCESIMEHGLINYGLGDWVSPKEALPLSPSFVQNAFLNYCYETAHKSAVILGRNKDAVRLKTAAENHLKIFNHAFYEGDGDYRFKRSTAYALALQFGLVPVNDQKACAEKLAARVRKNSWRADYGTAGSKAVPRALFENGYADDAFRLMTQEECPGYLYWKKQGATTFPELWTRDENSLNHGAFADIAACLYRYLAGFRHLPETPGIKHLEIRPCFPAGLDHFSAQYCGWECNWKRENGEICYLLNVPEGASGIFCSPDGGKRNLQEGRHRISITLQGEKR